MVNHFIYLFRPSNHLVLPRLHHPIKHSSLVNPQDSAGVVQLGMEIRQMLTAVLQIGVNHQDSAVVVQLGMEIRQMLTTVLQIGVNTQNLAAEVAVGLQIGTHPFQTEEFLAPIEVH